MPEEQKTVLIVEDDPHIAGLYREKLHIAGYRTKEAGEGRTGLEKALEPDTALVLLDMNLPDIDGSTMLKQLRADERGRDVAVVILTNEIESERLEEVKGLYSDYLLKVDLALDDLVATVQKYLF